MLQPEQLFTHLPRKVISWTPQDVRLWFALHSILLNPAFDFERNRFDGSSFLKVTPQFLYQECGIGSAIVIKKILEWIQQEVEEFEEYIDTQNCKPTQQKQQQEALSHSCEIQVPVQQLNKQNTPRYSQVETEIEKPQHLDCIQSLENVKKWKKGKTKFQSYSSKQITHQKSSENVSKPTLKMDSGISQSVKFAESSYQICGVGVQITYQFEGQFNLEYITKGARIGRYLSNGLIIKGHSVSREHAELIKINNDYYIKDVGSKFGTFREIGSTNNKPLEEGDIIGLGDTILEVLFLKINLKTKMFDIKLRLQIDKKKQDLNFFAKKTISIGRQNKCINIDDPEIAVNHCTLMINSDNNNLDNHVYMIKQQGQCFLKLKKEELYQLEDEQCIRLGLQKINVTLIKQKTPINISEFICQE